MEISPAWYLVFFASLVAGLLLGLYWYCLCCLCSFSVHFSGLKLVKINFAVKLGL